jgi:deoxyribonuclease-1
MSDSVKIVSVRFKLSDFPLLGLLLLGLLLFLSACSFRDAPQTFDQARKDLRHEVYYDQNDEGDFYCECAWQWTGESGGELDPELCGYQLRAQPIRAKRTEWEHVLPASAFGQTLQCWHDGGRENCNRTDAVFNAMEADMHNIVPALGEINADRSNYHFDEIAGDSFEYGACKFQVDSRLRIAEPRDAVKGQIARMYFYMHQRYGLQLSEVLQRRYLQWDAQFPVTAWEMERDRRIARVMGHHNPFVTGELSWALVLDPVMDAQIRGNRNSMIYHLFEGCPGYSQIAEQNRLLFESEQAALDAGYRKAGNCR